MRNYEQSYISGKIRDIYVDEDKHEASIRTVYIKQVKYNDPATIVFWSDGTKTVTKCCGDDIYSKEAGLAICVMKKLLGTQETFDIFMDWLPDEDTADIGVSVRLRDVRKKYKEIERFLDKVESGEIDINDVFTAIENS